ncbi:MarR family winged helix-turn-helix transcriptional regulator [Dietzia sp. ANT_WB102]|uniref:MarR family winged helix-turn-helix transcriptional regulator n=1 Tax=Dietzia sp. ANT_WB102 TaxID=2597345 RepID=UPI0011EEA793|nr:MarR family transcriptional regulator [Dietzia sp. ANT_WB102]KAA0918301.1 MarR family transcriptional regulator [Dietzia sp. ANT_WB102]
MVDRVVKNEVRWLNDSEKTLWRDYLAIQGRLHVEIQRDLKTSSSLTEPEFEVLAHLSEADSPLRMTALADALQWERSRLSHQVTRMVKRGLVQRTRCPDDGRGAFVTCTEEGVREIEKAAPDHVETVRRAFLDRLGERDKRELARLLALVRGPSGAEANRRSGAAGVASGA